MGCVSAYGEKHSKNGASVNITAAASLGMFSRLRAKTGVPSEASFVVEGIVQRRLGRRGGFELGFTPHG